jgi:hypothetical protein
MLIVRRASGLVLTGNPEVVSVIWRNQAFNQVLGAMAIFRNRKYFACAISVVQRLSDCLKSIGYDRNAPYCSLPRISFPKSSDSPITFL